MAAAAVLLAAICGVALPISPAAPHPAGTTVHPPRVGIDPHGRLRAFRLRYRSLLERHDELVRTWPITYRANDGRPRRAYVILPRWYGPKRHPPLPLVISPHGRGVPARDNVHFWGGLPAFGPFAVVNPEGQGRRLTLYSWGWRGQIDDLARMPGIVHRALPWLRIDPRRIYAVGSSMGGQETLLLVAFHPRMLAGAVALDSATDMGARYRAFPQLRGGRRLQRLARSEVGGTPTSAPRAYALRSPVYWAAAIARSRVPLHLWWSTADRIVRNQRDESGRLYRAILRINPKAPVTKYVGTWEHSREFHASARLPLALVELGLIELTGTAPAV
jgi:dipeptidyl aminopeptidase/acylaminoacyl peptidase